jgi:hypothetical protein
MSGKKETGVVVKKVKQDTSVDTFISQAIAGNLPVETMEKLFALREKVKAENAREAFVADLSGFQSECPIIEKTKKVMNKDGQTVRYQFAPIDSIVSQIKVPLAKYGFSYTWKVENETGFITAICTITHRLGHTQDSEFKIPIDSEGFMTAPQKYASALTFAMRYSLLKALGISTGDEDTDATDVNKDKTPQSNKSKIIFLLKTLGFDLKTKDAIEKKVKELANLDLVESNYGDIVDRLEILVKEQQEYDNSEV